MGLAASPLDPIFWLHHAQIDRLWGRWLGLGHGRANPTDPRWLKQKFNFYNSARQKVTQTPSEVLSTRALGYRYEDDPPPAAVPISAIVPEQAKVALESLEAITVTAPEPQELGASGAVKLGAGTTSTSIPLAKKPDADLEMLAVPQTSPTTVALIIEGIQIADPQTPTYEVYLNMPRVGDGGHHDSPHFVGFLEFFGVGHNHGGGEAGAGATRAFNITTLVHQLQQEGTWDPDKAKVSFVPAKVFEDAETGEPLPAPVEGTPEVKVSAIRIVAE
jgi:tyrosinase